MTRGPSELRKNEITDLAEWIAERYFGEEFIVEPEIVAERNDITYSYGHYKDAFDGLLEHEFGEFHIYINLDRSYKNSRRTRFTFAHELGHYFIDEHRNALVSGKTPSHPSFNNLVAKNPVEQEADFFASCLLMPSRSFREFCRGNSLSYDLLKALSENFDTSMSATLFRYFELDIFPMMIVLCRDGKVQWCLPTKDFKYKWPPKKGSDVPKSTLAGDYFYKGETNQHQDIVYPDDWFTDFEMDKSDELYEYCRCWDKTTLSIIWDKEY